MTPAFGQSHIGCRAREIIGSSHEERRLATFDCQRDRLLVGHQISLGSGHGPERAATLRDVCLELLAELRDATGHRDRA